MGAGVGHPVGREVDRGPAMGHDVPDPSRSRHGRELGFDEPESVLHPARAVEVGIRPRRRLAAIAARPKQRAFARVAGTAHQERLVEEVPEGHRQQLGQTTGAGVEEGGGVAPPSAADEAVQQLVGRPLRAVVRVERPDGLVVTERLVLPLHAHPGEPRRRQRFVRVAGQDPVLRQLLDGAVLEVEEEQARVRRGVGHDGGCRRSTGLPRGHARDGSGQGAVGEESSAGAEPLRSVVDMDSEDGGHAGKGTSAAAAPRVWGDRFSR